MSADMGLNAELLRRAGSAGDMGRERLRTAAHEIGHGLGELLGEGSVPQWVKVTAGWFFTSGLCQWGEMPAKDWPREKKIAHLVSNIAGHAADARFCRAYLGMDERRAWRLGRDCADGDYADFRFWRSRLGLWWSGISPEWAFDRATGLLSVWAEPLDVLTLRLADRLYLPGSELAAAVSAGPGRRRAKVRRPVVGTKVNVGARPEPREPEQRESWTRRLRDRIQGQEDRQAELVDDVADDTDFDGADFEGADDLISRAVEALTEYLSWENEEVTG